MKEPACPSVRAWLDRSRFIHTRSTPATSDEEDSDSSIYQIFTEDPLCAGTRLVTRDTAESKLKSPLTGRLHSNGGKGGRAHTTEHIGRKKNQGEEIECDGGWGGGGGEGQETPL